MKLTHRDKKLLWLWPIVWPLFFLLIFRHHSPVWWTGFFIGIALLTAALAAFKLVPMIFRRSQCSARSMAANQPLVTRHSSLGFTLIELLVVIAIIGILAGLIGPVLAHFKKGDSTLAATRQLMDDCARARQLAILNRATVYMAFVGTNFWQDPLSTTGNQWTPFQTLCPLIYSSTTVTQLYAAQLNGYIFYSLQRIGDQPGTHYPVDLQRVHTLPPNSYISPIKFTWPAYNFNPASPTIPFVIQTNYLMYGFLRTNNLPFPTSDALTNVNYANQLRNNPAVHFPTVAYIAFNYLGQLTRGDGSLLPYDEYIPLSYGTIAPARTQALPSAIEDPPGNSTNISYTLIHIDRFTGRARLESAGSTH